MEDDKIREGETCSYCKGLRYDPYGDNLGVYDICPECKGEGYINQDKQ